MQHHSGAYLRVPPYQQQQQQQQQAVTSFNPSACPPLCPQTVKTGNYSNNTSIVAPPMDAVPRQGKAGQAAVLSIMNHSAVGSPKVRPFGSSMPMAALNTSNTYTANTSLASDVAMSRNTPTPRNGGLNSSVFSSKPQLAPVNLSAMTNTSTMSNPASRVFLPPQQPTSTGCFQQQTAASPYMGGSAGYGMKPFPPQQRQQQPQPRTPLPALERGGAPQLTANQMGGKQRASADFESRRNSKATGVPPPVSRGPQPTCAKPTRLPNGQRIKVKPQTPSEVPAQLAVYHSTRRTSRFASMRQLPGGVQLTDNCNSDDDTSDDSSECAARNGAGKKGKKGGGHIKTGPGAGVSRKPPATQPKVASPNARKIKTTIGNDESWMRGLTYTTWVDSPTNSARSGCENAPYKRKANNHPRRRKKETGSNGGMSSNTGSSEKKTFVERLKSLFS